MASSCPAQVKLPSPGRFGSAEHVAKVTYAIPLFVPLRKNKLESQSLDTIHNTVSHQAATPSISNSNQSDFSFPVLNSGNLLVGT